MTPPQAPVAAATLLPLPLQPPWLSAPTFPFVTFHPHSRVAVYMGRPARPTRLVGERGVHGFQCRTAGLPATAGSGCRHALDVGVGALHAHQDLHRPPAEPAQQRQPRGTAHPAVQGRLRVAAEQRVAQQVDRQAQAAGRQLPLLGAVPPAAVLAGCVGRGARESKGQGSTLHCPSREGWARRGGVPHARSDSRQRFQKVLGHAGGWRPTVRAAGTAAGRGWVPGCWAARRQTTTRSASEGGARGVPKMVACSRRRLTLCSPPTAYSFHQGSHNAERPGRSSSRLDSERAHGCMRGPLRGGPERRSRPAWSAPRRRPAAC